MWYLNRKIWVAAFGVASAVVIAVYKSDELAAAVDALSEVVLRAMDTMGVGR